MIKPIPNFPGYFADTEGNIWSDKRGPRRKLKPRTTPYGYTGVTLCNNGKRHSLLSHRLVLETFVGPCPKGMEACHRDGNRSHNNLQNLRWDTRKSNHQDALEHGTHKSLHQSGEQNPYSKLNQLQVRIIRKLGNDLTQTEIGDIFNISRHNVGKILNNHTWKEMMK